MSHTELVTKAASECRTANQAASHLNAPGQSYNSLNTYAKSLSPIVQTLIGNLAALKPSDADRSALNGYVTALRNGDQGLKLLAGASSPAQVTQARTLLASQSIQSRATALGAAACGAEP
jgi:hypothetical protein